MTGRFPRWLHLRGLTPVVRALTPRHHLAIALVAAAVAGLLLGHIGAALGREDRIVVGNAGDVLHVLVVLEGVSIVIGGSDDRSVLADFVGRSTVPWARRVDLLVVPATDSRHVAAAVGLLERGGVTRVVILGAPDSDPIWQVLMDAALDTGADVQIADGRHVLPLSKDTTILFNPGDGDQPAESQGATVEVVYRGARIILLDAGSADASAQIGGEDGMNGVLAIVSLHPVTPESGGGVPLIVRPAPRRGAEFGPAPARFVANLERGERLVMPIADGQLRVPLDRLTPGTASPASTP